MYLQSFFYTCTKNQAPCLLKKATSLFTSRPRLKSDQYDLPSCDIFIYSNSKLFTLHMYIFIDYIQYYATLTCTHLSAWQNCSSRPSKMTNQNSKNVATMTIPRGSPVMVLSTTREVFVVNREISNTSALMVVSGSFRYRVCCWGVANDKVVGYWYTSCWSCFSV